MKDEIYNSCVKMNKPIRFFGLSSMQAIVLFVFVLVSVLVMLMSGINFLVMLVIVGGEIYGISILMKKLSLANKKGTPDFFGAYTTFNATPRKITDTNFIFSFLIKNIEEKDGN